VVALKILKITFIYKFCKDLENIPYINVKSKMDSMFSKKCLLTVWNSFFRQFYSVPI